MSGACRRKQHQNPINGLNFMREMVKTEKKKVVLSVEHGRACAWHGPCVHSPFLARPCVCTARVVRAVRTLVFAFCFYFFTHFCFELAFGVNMKVLDNFVSFPMDFI